MWVVREGKAQIQKVETGLETDREVAIRKGLENEDLVIYDPRKQDSGRGRELNRGRVFGLVVE